MRLSEALVEAGLFESRSRTKRWIEENKISIGEDKVKKDIELATGRNYAVEFHGNKLNGKYVLEAPKNPSDKYTARGPIQ